jgi:hypothetical protein
MLLVLVPLMTGCGINTLVGAKPQTDASCRVFRPITISPSDSEETKRQVLEHDQVWEEICGKQAGK